MTDKEEIFTILRSLWQEDNGLSPDHRICYNRALQDVQIAIDSMSEEPVSEDLEEAWRKAYEEEKDEILVVYDHHAGFVSGANWRKEQMAKVIIDKMETFIYHHLNCVGDIQCNNVEALITNMKVWIALLTESK